jgi:hypothetical protein
MTRSWAELGSPERRDRNAIRRTQQSNWALEGDRSLPHPVAPMRLKTVSSKLFWSATVKPLSPTALQQAVYRRARYRLSMDSHASEERFLSQAELGGSN